MNVQMITDFFVFRKLFQKLSKSLGINNCIRSVIICLLAFIVLILSIVCSYKLFKCQKKITKELVAISLAWLQVKFIKDIREQLKLIGTFYIYTQFTLSSHHDHFYSFFLTNNNVLFCKFLFQYLIFGTYWKKSKEEVRGLFLFDTK